jgi:hypothetical protein
MILLEGKRQNNTDSTTTVKSVGRFWWAVLVGGEDGVMETSAGQTKKGVLLSNSVVNPASAHSMREDAKRRPPNDGQTSICFGAGTPGQNM